MKKKELTLETLIDLWLLKYHGITYVEVVNTYPKEDIEGTKFYSLFPVEQWQHDEWEAEAKEMWRKHFKLKKSVADRYWGFTYLNAAPSVIKKEE